MSASEDSIFTRPCAPLLLVVGPAPPPDWLRCPGGGEGAHGHIECLESGAEEAVRPGTLEALLLEHGDSVAAVLVEPMLQGAGGMIVWPAEFLGGVRRLCNRSGTLMIADEVLTGFGRTGRMFACEHASVTPDIMCLSKALTAGYMPLGATLVTPAIYEAFLSEDRTRTFFHGHSFTANPLACAVACASLDLIHESASIDKVRALEGWLRRGLEPLRALPIVGDVRVIGGVGIVELVADRAAKSSGGYLDRVGPLLTAAFLERGLLMRPLGNIVYFMPPYVITEEETVSALARIGEVLQDVPRTEPSP
jgi:adenosylmethionine---8-amino-7-oxononanoate aminotransferase